ncbi:transposase [Streptomyces sp. NPDC058847]|uniref:transposase n=1 Tax=Streptomyces sp. NPDC058847 TaxID=3346649 RepID=UPI003697BEE4
MGIRPQRLPRTVVLGDCPDSRAHVGRPVRHCGKRGVGRGAACPVHAQCTSARRGNRMLTFHPERLHTTLAAARTQQTTQTWKEKYALRSGMEWTNNQALDVAGIRHARYRGQKVRLAARVLCDRDQRDQARCPLDRTRPRPIPNQSSHSPQLPVDDPTPQPGIAQQSHREDALDFGPGVSGLPSHWWSLQSMPSSCSLLEARPRNPRRGAAMRMAPRRLPIAT